MIITIGGIKGGSGKSTVATNLVVGSRQRKWDTLGPRVKKELEGLGGEI